MLLRADASQKLCRWLLVMLTLVFATSVATAQESKNSKESQGVRKSVWSVGIQGARHSLKAGDGNEVLGNAGAVQLGTGYISEAWFVNTTLDILLGPYEPTRGKQLNVDYFGTGVTVWAGFSAQTLNLRSQEGGYGFGLGLSYADSVGRSVGRNRREQGGGSPDDDALLENYVIRVTNFSMLPAIFFSWLKEARPRGNSPELLATRLEGFFLTFGVAMPLQATYKAEYDRHDGQETPPEKGRLRGYSILVSLTAMLGT